MPKTSQSTYEEVTGDKLPPYMEARPMKRGGFTFRVKLADGRKVALGWNREDALAAYAGMKVAARNRPEQIDVPAMAETMVRRHRTGAAARGLSFDITASEVEAMLTAQGLRCAVTGHPFDLRWVASRARPYAPSIDRMDNSKGYEPGNCRIVCAAVNAALGDLGDKLFGKLFRPLIYSMVEEAIRSTIVPILRDKARERKLGKSRHSVPTK